MRSPGCYIGLLSHFIFLGLTLCASCLNADHGRPDMTIQVDLKQPGKPLPRTWYASQKIFANTADRLPSDYILSRWRQEVGFKGDFRLQTALNKIAHHNIDLHRYAELCKDIVAEGGTPFLTILYPPKNLCSDPEELGFPPGTPEYQIKPNNLMEFKAVLKNYILFFSGQDLVINDPHLNLQNAQSQGIEGIFYHFWVEPTGRPWKDTYEEFFKMYDRFIQATREVRDEFPDLDFKVGGIHLNCFTFDPDCWSNIPYDPVGRRCEPLYFLERFLDYCTDPVIPEEYRVCAPPLEIEFFSFQTPRFNDADMLTRKHLGDYAYIKEVLDAHGYGDTEIIRADLLGNFQRVRAHYLPGYDFDPEGPGPEDFYAGCEVDNEIGATELCALLYDTSRSAEIPVDRYYFEFIRDIGAHDQPGTPDWILDYGLYLGDSAVGYAGGQEQHIEIPLMKAGFNVIKMIGQLKDTLLEEEYEEDFDNTRDLIRTVVTRDSRSRDLSILLWYYINPDVFQERWDIPVPYTTLLNQPGMVPRTVKLRLYNSNISLAKYRRFLMDQTHSNPWHYRKKIAAELIINNPGSQSDINEWPGCRLEMVDEKLVSANKAFEEEIIMKPYSVVLIKLDPKKIYHSLD